MDSVRPTFVLFGDSLTQQSFAPGGWGAALQNRYSRKADVVLRGFSGYNTRWAMFLLDKIFPIRADSSPPRPPPKLVTVFFGANDAALPNRHSKKQYVPLDEYRRNLVAIVRHVQSMGRPGGEEEVKVLLITPPPVDEAGRLRRHGAMYGANAVTEAERNNEVTGSYAEACKAAAAEANVPVVDLWSALQLRDDWRSLLEDGLHFTAEGNAAVFEEVLAAINLHFPSLQWDTLPWDYPEHTDIDGDDPAATFKSWKNP